jgi:predicted MFS family arabinose efflux permease
MQKSKARRSRTPVAGAGIDRRLMILLALTMFTASGTIHYQTPMLGAIGASFGANPAEAGWVATLTFGGFLLGILLLAPLGDRVDKRKLMLIQLSLVIVALIGMASAPTLVTTAIAGFVLGIVSGFTQNIVPIAAELARPEERGKAVATVLSALFLGILFARVVGGQVAAHFGWRWMYVMAAVMLLCLAPLLVLRLPSMPIKTRMAYGPLLRSLFQMLFTHAALRRASGTQFFLGICYGGFWATIAAMMMLLHGLGPAESGLMAIPGAAGVLAARPAGRWMDRKGASPVVKMGAALVLGAFVAMAFAPWSIVAIVAGAILLDCGLRSAMVANQTLVNSVAPDARSRFNTIFGAHVWGGNAMGAFLASTALAHFGWFAVCGVAVASAGCALLLQFRASPAPAH